MIIRIKLTKEKLQQALFYKGAKGTYIDCTLLENKNGTDEYGNDFMIVQDISQEARLRGEKGPIVGNARFAGERPAGARQPQQAATPDNNGRYSTRSNEAPRQAPTTTMKPAPEQMEGDPAW